MFSNNRKGQIALRDFRIDQVMRYSYFAPRLYNLCLSLGFSADQIMPSRAFCSDENQGFPIILITKHFGAFPFDHGRVGGIVSTSRHAPHAHHGEDMVIIQASHVGYDPETKIFGNYCRLQTTEHNKTTTCGKIGDVLQWYQEEYSYAQRKVLLGLHDGMRTITIDNQLLNEQRKEGLFLELDKMIGSNDDRWKPLQNLSTSRKYAATDEICSLLPEQAWQSGQYVAINEYLTPELFSFSRQIDLDTESRDHLESNLSNAMPWIVTSASPLLTAAQFNTQIEFDRTYRTIVKEHEYTDKNLLLISCLNIDISPSEGQVFPLTKCVPWAAYIQDNNGNSRTIEQNELIELLLQQSADNPQKINLEEAIQAMVDAPGVRIEVD